MESRAPSCRFQMETRTDAAVVDGIEGVLVDIGLKSNFEMEIESCQMECYMMIET